MKSFVHAQWDRVTAALMVLVGVIMLLIGWIGVSGTGLSAEQMPYVISGGLGGIVLVAIGCTLWLSADLQDEWRRLDALEKRLEELSRRPDPQVRSSDNGAAPRRRERSTAANA